MISRVSAIIFNQKQFVLIHRLKNAEEYYALPGGGIEPGETPKVAIIREIKEELGFSVSDLIQIHQSNSSYRNDYFFTCQTTDSIFNVTGPEIKYLHDLNDLFDPQWHTTTSFNKSLPIYPTGSKDLLEKFTR